MAYHSHNFNPDKSSRHTNQNTSKIIILESRRIKKVIDRSFELCNILQILICRISKKYFFAPEKVKAALDFTKN